MESSSGLITASLSETIWKTTGSVTGSAGSRRPETVSSLGERDGRAAGEGRGRLSKLKYDAHNPHIDNPAREYSMPLRRTRAIKCKACIRVRIRIR